jgi:hypothetical protein
VTLDVHVLDSGQAVATLGPIVIRVIVRARTEVADIDRLTLLVDRVLERSPGAGLWIIAHHGAPVPDKLVRRHGGRAFRPFGDRLCVAYSLLGLGFWASAATAATITLTKLMRMRSPIETSVERGAERLCMELIGVDPTRLIAAHDQLLERISAHPQTAASASGRHTNA